MILLQHAVTITGFVFVMMLLVEYANVVSTGQWHKRLSGSRWGQYLLAAFLGATPGCLGAFAVVTLYTHRTVTLGAVVAAMIATAGDESFVMFAMIPKQALAIHALLFITGITAGILTDIVVKKGDADNPCPVGLVVHPEQEQPLFQWDFIAGQWRNCIASRGILALFLAFFLGALVAGGIGPAELNWIKGTMLLLSAAALFVVCTASDHFMEEHLWRHIALKHVPRLFLWTFGALLAVHLLEDYLPVQQSIHDNPWIVLVTACLMGLIPESGPHLIFVTLYANGAVPGSILFASSIVQDGHGMLPLLAHSRSAFIKIKAVNFTVGMACGAAGLVLGI